MRSFSPSWHAILLALLLAAPAALRADPLESTDANPVLRDPAPRAAHNFPLAIAGGGVADPGGINVRAVAHNGCNATNPCAIATPSQSHVDAPRPAKPG